MTFADYKAAFELMEKQVGYHQASEVISTRFNLRIWTMLDAEDFAVAVEALNSERLAQRKSYWENMP